MGRIYDRLSAVFRFASELARSVRSEGVDIVYSNTSELRPEVDRFLLGSIRKRIGVPIVSNLVDAPCPCRTIAVRCRRFVDHPGDYGIVSRAARETVLSRYSTSALARHYESKFDDGQSARRRWPQTRSGEQPTIPLEFLAEFPGFFRQCKHRAADIWRFVAYGQQAVHVARYDW
jgi:hypothetical protein